MYTSMKREHELRYDAIKRIALIEINENNPNENMKFSSITIHRLCENLLH